MPTTANTINYYIAADGTLRDGQAGSIAQTPRIYYGTEYAVTLSFPPSTIAEGDQLQVAVNRSRTFFSSASATGDAPVAAVAKHEVTAAEATAQAVTLTLSTNTRAMIDQVNGIDHPVRGFFGVHVLRGQSFVTLAVADAFMMSLESGPDAISPSLPVVDYPTREEAEQIKQDTIAAQEKAETAQEKAEEAQGKAEEAQGKAEEAQGKAETAQTKAETAQTKAETAQTKAEEARDEAIATLANKRDILQTLVTSSSTALEVEAGKSYNWTVSAASTISMKAADKVASKETRIDIYIDLQSGGSVSGSGVVVADSVLQSGWYKLIWDGTNATLYSTKAGGAASVITIPSSSTSYTLQDNKHYQQIPSAVPTYTLPTATIDGLVHEITVLVDFMHVTSCSFVDAGGVPVTLQSAISPQIGEAYLFRCYWYGKWRVVPLKIRNAATVSSATGVVEVSDAVAGDALALKMTAPRSVVVNQFIPATSTAYWKIYSMAKATLSDVDGALCSTVVSTLSAYTDSAMQVKPAYVYTAYANHKYLVSITIKSSDASVLSFRIETFNGTGVFKTLSTVDTWQTFTYFGETISGTNRTKPMLVYPYVSGQSASEAIPVGLSFYVKNVMVVDLTQYFNGDKTLIDSITSWDDLVAYDPRFASYVEYNTGTVEGVQPQVKVGGKNLLDDSIKGYNNTFLFIGSTTLDGGMLLPAGTYTWRTFFNGNESTSQSGGTGYISIDGAVAYSKHTVTLTKPSYCHCRVYPKPASDDFSKYTAQIELGDQATAYEPYHDGGTATSPSELFAVGNAADKFEAVSGVTTKKIGSYTFTGNETWVYNYIGQSDRRYGFTLTGVFPGIKPVGWTKTAKIILEGYDIGRIYDLSAQGVTANGAGVNNSGLVVFDSAYTDAVSFAAHMSGKNFYYELATPTTEQSTPTQIFLQAGNNVAMQTDGGRTLGELSMTYENLPSDN